MRIQALVVTVAMLMAATGAEAQDAPAAAEEPPPLPAGTHMAPNIEAKIPQHRPSWSYAFDLRATTMAGKFTPLLAAQWNKIFRSTDTEVGVAAAGMPQTVKKDVDGGTAEYVQYSYGLDVAQPFIADEDFRVGAGLVLGQGVGFVRTKPDTGKTRFKGVNYKLAEPSVYFTFYQFRSLDLGVSASMRIAMANEAKDLKSSDVTAFTIGATFRERRSR